jgi:hypothetical protein
MLVRKSGAASRVADLRLDAAAKAAALAVRQADDGYSRATERFLSRFLDHLHNTDNASRGLAPLDYPDMNGPGRRRGRPRSG